MIRPFWREARVAAIVGLAACGLLASASIAQSKPGGVLLGQVVDAGTNRPVAGAVVVIAPMTGAASQSADNILYSSGRDAAISPDRVIADAGGRFLFHDLPRGRYALAATAPGYLPGLYGQQRTAGSSLVIDMAEADRIRDLTIRLWKPAAINGTVTDEFGEPAVGVQVRSLRRGLLYGVPRWAPDAVVLTDDRGAYRMANLTPGEYIVGVISTQTSIPATTGEAWAAGTIADRTRTMATLNATGAPAASSSGFRIGDTILAAGPAGLGRPGAVTPPPPGDTGRFLVYPTVFYPAAPTSAQAAPVAVRSGEDRTGVDLRLRLVPGVKVTGVVRGPDGAVPNVGVRLLPLGADQLASESGAETALTSTGPNGEFTFLGVPAGTYILNAVWASPPPIPVLTETASVSGSGGVSFSVGGSAPRPAGSPTFPPPPEPSLWFASTITVGETDVTGLAVQLRPGFLIGGRLEFAGTKAPPPEEQVLRMQISVTPVGTSPAVVGGAGRVIGQNRFATPGRPPGRYLVSVQAVPAGWSLVAAMINGRDVSDVPLEIDAANVEDIVLKFSDRTTTLSGAVVAAGGQPDANADVIVFPADHTLWKQFGVTARRSRITRTSRSGGFTIVGLPPGDYFVAAVASSASADWQAPGFLDALARSATRVSLAEGAERSADLRTVTVR